MTVQTLNLLAHGKVAISVSLAGVALWGATPEKPMNHRQAFLAFSA
jgi:hypothetical protein